jgi:HK97 gp10 family phage protein
MKTAMLLLGAREAAALLTRGPERMRAGLARGLDQAAMIVEGAAKELVYAGHPEHLEVQKGRLRQSITRRVHTEGAMYAEVGTNVIYARIHEFGGVIRPTQAHALAVPIGDLKGSPRNYRGLWTLRRPGRAPLLMDRSGKPQYVLAEQVVMPARPYLRPALAANAQRVRDKIREVMEEALRA